MNKNQYVHSNSMTLVSFKLLFVIYNVLIGIFTFSLTCKIQIFFLYFFNRVHLKSQAINILNNTLSGKWLIKMQYNNFSLTRKNGF